MDSRETQNDSINSSEDEQNIWSSILKQVQNSGSSTKLPSSKAVIVLGENETGKTSLIAKMQGNEEPRKGSGLEYHHMLVRDEYRDEHTKLGVWVLDGDPFHRDLLKFSLNESTFGDTTIMLVASMTAPWDIMDSLEKWASILEDEINKRIKMSPEQLKSFQRANLKRYQEYISPGDEIENLVSTTSPTKSSTVTNGDNEWSENQMSTSTSSVNMLPEGVLTHNLGLDIIVVISKTDYMSVLEKEHDYKEEAFDFIQQATRKFCLKYGASLFYVSAKINKNCDLLYKYLVHRIYGLPFKTPALVVEKDALFIPSGWDSEKKIAILYENITSVSPDDPFNEVITKPSTSKVIGKDDEISAEDDQVFLSKMHSQISSQAVPNSSGTPGVNQPLNQSPSYRPSPGIQSAGKSERRSVAGSTGGTPSMDGSKASPGGEGVLQNFFNSLLNRKSVGGLPPSANNSPRTPLNNGSSTNRVDMVAEFDRLSSNDNGNGNEEIDRSLESDTSSLKQQSLLNQNTIELTSSPTSNSSS